MLVAAEIPPLDRRRLEEIEEDLGSRAPAVAFAERFLHMLPGRIHAIATAVEAGEVEAIRTALLSLAISAEMVGAVQLASGTWAAEAGLRSGGHQAVREALPQIEHDAAAARLALVSLLVGGSRPTTR